jgi:hypothetical protein
MNKMMMLVAAGALVAFSSPAFAASPTSCPKGQHLVDTDANGGTKCVASCKKGEHLVDADANGGTKCVASCKKGEHLVDADANGGTKCVASCKKGQHLDKTGRKCLPGKA